jgi:hypothetical protein
MAVEDSGQKLHRVLQLKNVHKSKTNFVASKAAALTGMLPADEKHVG